MSFHIKIFKTTKVVIQIDTQSSALEINMLQSFRMLISERLHRDESSFCKIPIFCKMGTTVTGTV